MSLRAMSWVWTASRSSGTARLVLLAIADEASDRGETWSDGVKTQRLAAKANTSVRQVRRHLRELEDLEELAVECRRGRGRPNVYRMVAYRREVGIEEKPDAGDRLTAGKETGKPGASDRLRVKGKPDSDDRLKSDRKADAGDRLMVPDADEKPDTKGLKNRSPVTGPIDDPTTVPTTTATATEPSPLPTTQDSGGGRLTPQQAAFGRVQALFARAEVEIADGKVAALMRNAGGVEAVDPVLMPVLRRLANRNELSVAQAFTALATEKRQRGPGRRTPAARSGARPATLDDARRERLEEIANESTG